jgi:N-acetylglucosamine-6-sulfatase
MKPARRRWLAGALAGLILVAGVAAVLVVSASGDDDDVSTELAAPANAFDARAPNVVVVMTDDQALDTMAAMPQTRRLIGRAGTSFERAFVSYPLCCPSRATFLTGQYAHNHGVMDNKGPEGGYQALDRGRTLPVWLTRAGYRTGFVGKFLNGYGKGEAAREVPPGWSEWYGLPGKGKQRAFDFDINENGELVHYGDERRRPYKTHVLADKAVSFVRRSATRDRPFFLWVATNGPHKDGSLPAGAERNPEPAPRDRGMYEGKRAPRKAAVDERDVSDKPRAVRSKPPLGLHERERLDREYVSQLESLRSIDRLVARLVGRLRASGELDETVLMFTTDNGYLRGQHRLEGKSRPYDESIRVPLMIRGPGFERGTRDRRLVVNADLAATIAELAGARPDLELDGHSLRPDAEPAGHPREEVLIEVLGRKQPWSGLRTERFTYAEYANGDVELYDLRNDPEQLRNIANAPRAAQMRKRLAGRLAELRECAGADECG